MVVYVEVTMPFKSKAQWRYMFANHPKIAKRWAEHTKVKFDDLPERKEDDDEKKSKEKKAMDVKTLLKTCSDSVLRSVGTKLIKKKVSEMSRAAMVSYLDRLAAGLPLRKQASVRAAQLYICAGRPLTYALQKAFKLKPEDAGLLAADLIRGVSREVGDVS